MADLENSSIENCRKKMQNHVVLIMRLKRAKLCVVQLLENTPLDLDVRKIEVFLAIHDALIISYASCFAQSFDHRAKLDAKKVFKNKPELLKIHDRARLTRNSLVAHNGHNATVQENVDILPKDGFWQIEFGAKLIIPSSRELNELDQIIGHSYDYVREKMLRFAKQLEIDIGKKVNISKHFGEVQPWSN